MWMKERRAEEVGFVELVGRGARRRRSPEMVEGVEDGDSDGGGRERTGLGCLGIGLRVFHIAS